MMKPTLIEITKLRILSRIGLYDWEQRILQPLDIDLRLTIAENTFLDYADVAKKVTAFLQSETFDTLERVAETLVTLLKTSYAVSAVTIRVAKPFAIPGAQTVAVVLEQ